MVLGTWACKKDETPNKEENNTEQKEDEGKEDKQPEAPTVTTGAASSVTLNSFVIGGEVTATNGADLTEVGIYWGETSDATEKIASEVVANSFSVTVSGLDFNKKYYVKAYAVNSAGTGYGELVEVTTADDPVITFADAALQEYMSFKYGDDNGELRQSDAAAIAELDIADQGIQSLEGIKALSGLRVLNAKNNSLANVDLSGMESLESVDISWNKEALQSVNIDGCTSLKTLIANDPADGNSPESFIPDAPALETLNISLWRSMKTLDLSKCVNLKRLDGCQLYVLESLDLTYSNVLESVWIPDVFAVTNFKISSTALDYLCLSNAKVLTSIDLSSCPNIREFVANDSYEVTDFKINCPQTLKILNINCFRKITSLDLSEYVNLERLEAIQLYDCTNFQLPTSLNHLTYAWLADMLKVETLTFKDLPANTMIKIWNCPALRTFNYESAQEVVGWDYDNDPNVVTNIWQIPGNDLTAFNIKAPNAKKLYCSNLHALPSLDLSECRNLEYICMPDLWVMTSFNISACTKLTDLWIWAANELTSLDVSHCAMSMNEINADNDNKLAKIIMKTGQTVTTLIKPGTTAIEYVD